jgi:hypothetical protein
MVQTGPNERSAPQWEKSKMKHIVATWLTLGTVSSTRLSITHAPFVVLAFSKLLQGRLQ